MSVMTVRDEQNRLLWRHIACRQGHALPAERARLGPCVWGARTIARDITIGASLWRWSDSAGRSRSEKSYRRPLRYAPRLRARWVS